MNCFKFYINKYSFIKDEVPTLDFIPMLMRRKLDNFSKAGLYTLYNVYNEDDKCKLLFASCYGDIERVIKLINQRKEEGEISPAGFSFSVHNATIGLFSLLNSIKESYNSISAGNNTLTNGLIEAIIESKTTPTIYCYTENNNKLESIALYISNKKDNENAIEVEIYLDKKEDITPSFDDFIDFLNGNKNTFDCYLYSLIRK